MGLLPRLKCLVRVYLIGAHFIPTDESNVFCLDLYNGQSYRKSDLFVSKTGFVISASLVQNQDISDLVQQTAKKLITMGSAVMFAIPSFSYERDSADNIINMSESENNPLFGTVNKVRVMTQRQYAQATARYDEANEQYRENRAALGADPILSADISLEPPHKQDFFFK